jgi:hypothetical protein
MKEETHDEGVARRGSKEAAAGREGRSRDPAAGCVGARIGVRTTAVHACCRQ